MSSDHVQLKAEPRTEFGSAVTRRLRRSGAVPGVLHTAERTTVAFHMPHHDLYQAVHGAAAKTMVFELAVGADKAVPALLKDWQLNPVRNELIHVDFQEVDLKVAVQAAVPLVLVGNPVGVREGGVLDQTLHEIMVEALPDAIPEGIELDVSELDIGDVRYFNELTAPSGVTLIGEDDVVLVSIIAPTVVTEPVEGEEDEATEPELVGGEGKGEEGGE